jgi:hypothetical protein
MVRGTIGPDNFPVGATFVPIVGQRHNIGQGDGGGVAGRVPGCAAARPAFYFCCRRLRCGPGWGVGGTRTGATNTRLGGTPVKRANP